MLNSDAYKELPSSSAKALPYFLGRIKAPYYDPQRFSTDFTFSYPEAKRLGFAKGTWSSVIKDLIAFGWVDPIDKGGLRGFKKGYNIFRLSKRWERYGMSDFKKVDWETFFPKLWAEGKSKN